MTTTEENVQTDVQETAPAEETQSQATANTEQTDTSAEAAAEASTETPAYEPNFKFKVLDEEKEVAEAFRSLIKDPDTEKMVKELHEKAYGLDHVKKSKQDLETKYQDLDSRYTDTSTQYTALKGDVDRLGQYLEKGDLNSFFTELQIPQDTVFNWVQQRLNEMNLPPEQRQALEQTRQTAVQKFSLEQQVNDLRSQVSTQAAHARDNELNQALQQNTVKNVAETFDTRVGTPGAFKEEVIKHAQLVWHSQKKDISVSDAIGAVMDRIGKVVDMPATTGTQLAPGGAQVQQGAGGEPVVTKPTIPNMQAGGASPINQPIRSLDDLKKRAASL